MSNLWTLEAEGASQCYTPFGNRLLYKMYLDGCYEVGYYVKYDTNIGSTNTTHQLHDGLYKIMQIVRKDNNSPVWLLNGYCIIYTERLSDEEVQKTITELARDTYSNGVYNELNRGDISCGIPEILQMIDEYVTKDTCVLDVGCGNCIPYGKYMFDKCMCYTGIDICKHQCEEEDKVVPKVHIINNDYLNIDFNRPVDVVFFLYSFFYYTPNNQIRVLEKLRRELSANGTTIILVRSETDVLQSSNNWCGSKILWSHTGPDFIKKQALKIGFSILVKTAEFNHEYTWVVLH